MNQQEAEFRALYGKFLAWQQSQQDQTDGYAFEQSFQAFTQDLNQQLMALSLQANEPKPEQPKKK
jgi:hypothetical protein